jgi:hypothetical protein
VVSRRLKTGDVFVVPLGDGRAGVGQVVGSYGKDAYFFAIFDAAFPADEVERRANEVVREPVLFVALSMDAKIHAGHWTVVGSSPVPEHVPLPAYKEAVGSPTQFDVVDYAGSRRRPATQVEAATLPNRKVVAPVRLEKALRASKGLEPWLEIFDELRADHLITTADVFG